MAKITLALIAACSLVAQVASQGYDNPDGTYLQFDDSEFTGNDPHGDEWVLEATNGFLTGSYQNPMCYSGGDSCHLDVGATASVNVDAETNTGVMTVSWYAENYDLTNSSDPLFAPQGQYMGLTGDFEIRYTTFADPTTTNSNKFMEGGVATNVFLHGTAAPVFPLSHAFYASWGPAELYLNGTRLFSDLDMFGHTMLTEKLYLGDERTVTSDCSDSNSYWMPMMASATEGEGCVQNPPEPAELHFNFRTSSATGVTVLDDGDFMSTPLWIHLIFHDIVDNSPVAEPESNFPVGLAVGIGALVVVAIALVAFVLKTRPDHTKHEEIKETPRAV